MTTQQHTESKVSKLKPAEIQSESQRPFSTVEEVNRLFETMSPRNWMRPVHWDWPEWSHLPAPFGGKVPRVDMVDRDDELLIRAELAGVEKDDLDVSMTNNSITIKGRTASEARDEKENYYRAEIAGGEFSRTLVLPEHVDTDKIRSTFKNGLLEMHIPKLAKTEKRKIEIE